MAEYSIELKGQLKQAQSVEELAELLKANGQDVSEAEKLWNELGRLRAEEDQELSLDELEAVSGGRSIDLTEEGCAASVEYGSDCVVNDGGCTWAFNDYHPKPVNVKCDKCGAYMYKHKVDHPDGTSSRYLYCPKCGRWIFLDHVEWDSLIPG